MLCANPARGLIQMDSYVLSTCVCVRVCVCGKVLLLASRQAAGEIGHERLNLKFASVSRMVGKDS